jgi:V/A-type H+-transporting ATPase subunit E
MSIENITEKILAEANDAASAILQKAESQSLEIINEAKSKANDFLNNEALKSENDAEVLKQRKVSAAQLQAKKMLLSAKQESINKSFDEALKKLNNISEEVYINFIISEIEKSSLLEGELVLNEKDKKNIGEKLVILANEKLNTSKIILSEKTIQASGGFVLKNGNIEINSTFETILSSIKDELTFEVANVIFK